MAPFASRRQGASASEDRAYTTTDPKTGKKVRKKSPTWWIRYYLPSGERKKVKGYRDKKATEALATEHERRAARQAAGLIDPMEDHAKKLIAEHAEDFRRYLAANGNTEEYVSLMLFRLSTCLNSCRFIRMIDLQASAVVEFLGKLRAEGKSVKTANDYLGAVKGFTRWLWRDKRIAIDPLAGLSKLPNGEADLRHARRDFSPEELTRLLESARTNTKSIRKLSGLVATSYT